MSVLTHKDLRELARAWGWSPKGELSWLFFHGDGYDTYGWYLTDEEGDCYQLPTRAAHDESVNKVGADGVVVSRDQGEVFLTETDAYTAYVYVLGSLRTTPRLGTPSRA